MTVRIGSLCTGYGGLDMAAMRVFGGELTFVAENDEAAVKLLNHHHPGVKNLGDITKISWSSVPSVDVLTAGFPCQDISHTGKRAGIKEGNRSGIWYNVIEAVWSLRPRVVILENVAAITTQGRGLDQVLGDLAKVGYDAEWICLRASDIGAPHQRERWFCLAWPRGGYRVDGYGGSFADRYDFGVKGSGPKERATGGHSPSSVGGTSVRDLPIWQWGKFTRAIFRWQRLTDVGAPYPMEPSRGGGRRPTVEFLEWMMGLPQGYVSEVPGISRYRKIRLLGNGVVPAQGEAAIRLLLERSNQFIHLPD